MLHDDVVLQRIDAVLERVNGITAGDDTAALERECIAATTGILEGIYGTQSRQIQQFTDAISKIDATFGHIDTGYFVSRAVRGSLAAARTDVAQGRIGQLIAVAASEILIDFVDLAQRALEEGRKDVAAVLSAAAFEDAMRRKAQNAGLSVAGNGLSETINALKSGGLLSKPQAQVATAYVTFRNKALHADWDKLFEPEVASVIAFVKHFAAGIGS